jgi:hypothetical protein
MLLSSCRGDSTGALETEWRTTAFAKLGLVSDRLFSQAHLLSLLCHLESAVYLWPVGLERGHGVVSRA